MGLQRLTVSTHRGVRSWCRAGWRGETAPAGVCFTGDSGPPPPTSVHSPLCGTWCWTAVAQHGSVANPPAGARSIPWSFSVSGGGGWWGETCYWTLGPKTGLCRQPTRRSAVRSLAFRGDGIMLLLDLFFPCRIACLVCS